MAAPSGDGPIDFFAALDAKDDALAIRAIAEFREISSTRLYASAVIPATGMLQGAVIKQRPAVVRAVVRGLSAYTSLNTLRDTETAGRVDALTDVGIAVIMGVPMLAVSAELGADLSFVCRQGRYVDGKLTRLEMSAVEFAISNLKADCLDYLLSEGCPGFSSNFESVLESGAALMATARKGSAAIPVYKVLMKHGVNMRSLETTPIIPLGARGPEDLAASLADLLLMQARQCGDAKLVTFLVTEMGLRGNTETAKAMVSDADYSNYWPDQPSMGNALQERLEREMASQNIKTSVGSKYLCSTCKTTCATKICKGCRESRYCSVACQTRDWRNGHKEKCSERSGGPSEDSVEVVPEEGLPGIVENSSRSTSAS